MISQMIDNSLESLKGEFRIKSKVLMEVCNAMKFRITPFETFRTRARQAWLYANKKPGQPVGVPWTSMHEKGKAVDWIFSTPSGQPSWVWPYPSIHFIWFMCGCTPIYSKGKLIESCHLQDDGKSIATVMKNNSARYQKETAKNQALLAEVNAAFRRYWYK